MRKLIQPVLFAALIVTAWTPTAAQQQDRNHLNSEASPYLRQHATDPVHWRAWTDTTLAEAKRRGRPILLSIGYSACHWCHVMQRESFADPATAKVINDRFFPILIDREERPDLDMLYQSTAALLDLPTGWPLTAFLTPEGQVFFTGTYFPPVARLGMPAFTTVLDRAASAFAKNPDGVRENARMIRTVLTQVRRPRPGEITSALRTLAAVAFMDEADTLAGGFGNSVKFPQVQVLEFLWRQHIRTGSAPPAEHVLESLRAMIRGGIYDHVGGGFFRYTTDTLWRVPHFEKMLDVNSALLRLMIRIWRETRDPELARAIEETVAFLTGPMRLASGGFAASLDADSRDPDGVEREGAFFRWRHEEIDKVLGHRADAFYARYDIAPLEVAPGTDEDEPDRGTIYRLGADADSRLLGRLHDARAKRHHPRRDDKILADWNGLAIAALSEAGLAFGRPEWTRVAVSAFATAARLLSDPAGRLRQSAVGERRGPLAALTGLAAMTDGAISLFEATGDAAYLRRAEKWMGIVSAHHGDAAAGGLFDSADDAEGVPLRLKSTIDDPNTSGNAWAARSAARLYFHTGDGQWRDLAERTVNAHGGAAARPELGKAGLLSAADTLQSALQVVIIGERRNTDTARLMSAVMKRSLPAQVLQVILPGAKLPDGHPAAYKTQIDGQATVYVCRGTICSLPATSADELDRTLLNMRSQRP